MPRCRWVFSSTTMALSTSGPIARNRPPSVITLIVLPVAYRPMIAAEDRQRQRQRRDQRHPPVAEEDQDHDRDQDRPDDALVDQAVDRLADVLRLVHDEVELASPRAVRFSICGNGVP